MTKPTQADIHTLTEEFLRKGLKMPKGHVFADLFMLEKAAYKQGQEDMRERCASLNVLNKFAGLTPESGLALAQAEQYRSQIRNLQLEEK